MKLIKELSLIFILSVATYSQQITQNKSKLSLWMEYISKSPVNPNFIKAIEVLLHKALKYHYKTVYFVAAVNNEHDEYFNELKSQLIIMSNEQYVLRLDTTKLTNLSVSKIRQNSLFIIDDIDNFRTISKTIVPERYRINGNFLFVLARGYFEELEEMYEALWNKNIHSIYAIYEHAGEILLSTFVPFESPKTCGSTKPKIIAKFIDGKFNDKLSFPRKIRNLQKCPLRLVTHIDSTFVHMRKFINGSYELYGRGITFMNTLSDALNYTNEVTVGKGDMPWGVVYENGTITGNFAELYKGRADIAFAEYYMKVIRNKYFDSSLTHYTTSMVFIIPPGRRYKSIEKMLQPFDLSVWIWLLVTISMAVIVILFISTKLRNVKTFVYGHGVKTPVTNIFIGLFGLQQTTLPKRNFARFILMMFLILCLVLRNIYQGSLFQFLQSEKRHKEVQSIDEMIKQDFTFYMYESALDVLKNQTEILKRTKVFNKTRNFLFDIQFNGDEKIAGLDSIITIDTEIYNGSNIRYLKEALITFNIVLYFRKNFYLRDEIDKKIDDLISSGIIEHWLKSSYKYYGISKVKDRHPRKLTFLDLRGIFFLLLVGSIISFLIFLVEKFSYRKMCEWSKMLNKIIN